MSTKRGLLRQRYELCFFKNALCLLLGWTLLWILWSMIRKSAACRAMMARSTFVTWVSCVENSHANNSGTINMISCFILFTFLLFSVLFVSEVHNIMPAQRRPCRCGSINHSRISHQSCPLNPVNLRTRRCRCGSTTHSRVSHQFCPLNPANAVIDNVVGVAEYVYLKEYYVQALTLALTLSSSDPRSSSLMLILKVILMLIEMRKGIEIYFAAAVVRAPTDESLTATAR